MKRILTLILGTVLGFTLNAQYSPETAVRVPFTPHTIQWNSQQSPSGIDYGCVDETDNCYWMYFLACDSVNLSVKG